MRSFTLIALSALTLSACGGSGGQASRDQIKIVGSSTVYPFTTMVAEQFVNSGSFKAPVIESTGTGGGMKLFCAGVGPQHPDMTNASRRMTASEFDLCQRNGVKQLSLYNPTDANLDLAGSYSVGGCVNGCSEEGQFDYLRGAHSSNTSKV